MSEYYGFSDSNIQVKILSESEQIFEKLLINLPNLVSMDLDDSYYQKFVGHKEFIELSKIDINDLEIKNLLYKINKKTEKTLNEVKVGFETLKLISSNSEILDEKNLTKIRSLVSLKAIHILEVSKYEIEKLLKQLSNNEYALSLKIVKFEKTLEVLQLKISEAKGIENCEDIDFSEKILMFYKVRASVINELSNTIKNSTSVINKYLNNTYPLQHLELSLNMKKIEVTKTLKQDGILSEIKDKAFFSLIASNLIGMFSILLFFVCIFPFAGDVLNSINIYLFDKGSSNGPFIIPYLVVSYLFLFFLSWRSLISLTILTVTFSIGLTPLINNWLIRTNYDPSNLTILGLFLALTGVLILNIHLHVKTKKLYKLRWKLEHELNYLRKLTSSINKKRGDTN